MHFLTCVVVNKNIFSIPNIKIFSDKMADVETLKKFDPYIGYWCPNATSLKANPEGLKFMHDSGKPVWTYLCGSGKHRTPMLNRQEAWLAFKYNCDGIGYHAYYDSWQGDDWNEFDGKHADWSKVYLDQNKQVVPSRRWEAWREGLEDWLCLDALRTALKKAKAENSASNADIDDAETLLIQGVDEIESSNKPEVLSKMRLKVIDSILNLQKKDK